LRPADAALKWQGSAVCGCKWRRFIRILAWEKCLLPLARQMRGDILAKSKGDGLSNKTMAGGTAVGAVAVTAVRIEGASAIEDGSAGMFAGVEDGGQVRRWSRKQREMGV
jgi:hypothetical protein